jgi:hypothetical protein
MNPLLKLLSFLRVVDAHDGTVSWTTVALIVVVMKLALAPAAGFAEIGGLFLALLAHQGKKLIHNARVDVEEQALVNVTAKAEAMIANAATVEDVEALKARVSKLSAMANLQGL